MSSIEQLATPALLLDLDVLERNLARMAERANALGVRLRPHAKTHKCLQVADLQRKNGATGITVSTLCEAKIFADHGFDDITWAFPVILNRVDEALGLASRIKLGLVIDSRAALKALVTQHNNSKSLRVWLKVDCGYHRAGMAPDSEDLICLACDVAATAGIEFAGILTHSGHAYHAADQNAMRLVAEQERSVMVDVASRIRAVDVDVPDVSVGSTPAMSVVETLDGVSEARPGNYAFYDYAQCVLGSCETSDVAVSVLTSVVSKMPDHSVVDAGALAMSVDAGPRRGTGMGPIYDEERPGHLHQNLQLASVSQEHGIVNQPMAIGTRLRVMPNHSCLTVACFDEYHVVRGATVVDRWKIWRGR